MRTIASTALCLALFLSGALMGCQEALDTKLALTEIVVRPGQIIQEHPEWPTPTKVRPHTGFQTFVWDSTRVEVRPAPGATAVLFRAPTGRMVLDREAPWSVRFDVNKTTGSDLWVDAWATHTPEHELVIGQGDQAQITQHFSRPLRMKFQAHRPQTAHPCPHHVSQTTQCGKLVQAHDPWLVSHDGNRARGIFTRMTPLQSGTNKFLIPVKGDGVIAAPKIDVEVVSPDERPIITLRSPSGTELPLSFDWLNDQVAKTNPAAPVRGFEGEKAKGKWTLSVTIPPFSRREAKLEHFALKFHTDCE